MNIYNNNNNIDKWRNSWIRVNQLTVSEVLPTGCQRIRKGQLYTAQQCSCRASLQHCWNDPEPETMQDIGQTV